MNALGKTLDIVWTASNPKAIKWNLDGTGGIENPGRLHEWLNLGRYDRDLQNRIKKSYTGKHLHFFGLQPLGIGALNVKILEDGSAIYPENQ